MNRQKASWEKLTEEEVATLKGHVGPGWLPQWFCNKMAYFFCRVFTLAVQEHHDFGYIVGGGSEDRYRCDQELLRHMRKDCANHSGEKRRLACFVTDLIYIVVRLFGWLSFQWRERPLTHPEVRIELEIKMRELKEEGQTAWKWLALGVTIVPLILFSVTSYLIYKLLPYAIGQLKKKTRNAPGIQDSSTTSAE